MKTVTNVINAATVTAAAERNAGATKLDTNALSVNDITIQGTIASDSNVGPGNGKKLDVYYAFSTNSYSTAADAVTGLAASAQLFSIKLDPLKNVTRYYITDKVTLRARYMYVWFSHDDLDKAVTLTVDIVS